MKNLKSLQVVALAGVAVALTAGCSSTSSNRADTSSDSNAAYRWVSSGGWVPITDVRRVAAFPPGWVPGRFGPVSYETYIMTPPAAGDVAATGSAGVSTSASASGSTTVTTDGSSTTVTTDRPGTTVASNGSTTTVTTGGQPEFSESMQPGDTFVEAAGANSDSGTVRRVILYSPFGTTGLGH